MIGWWCLQASRRRWRKIAGDEVSITRLFEISVVRRRRVAESLVVALFFASAAELMVDTPVLESLNLAMLYVTPGILTREPPPDVASEILVVTIRPRLFETEFGGQTPIPRAPFTRLLNDVVHTFGPEVLAVDYDLSPGCSDLPRDKTVATRTEASDDRPECGASVAREVDDRKDLDRYLVSSPAKALVLIRLPVEDEAHCRLRDAWEKQMREGGVVFGEPDLVHHGLFNAVVKYEDSPQSFARRVYCAALASGAEASRCGRSTPASERERCGPRAQQQKERPERKYLSPLNFPRAVQGVRTCHIDGPRSIQQCAAYYGRGFRVVFVGANYDSSDIFETPVGPKPGVTLHAYTAYSMKYPVRAHPALAFLIDVIFGTIVGVIFLRTWGHHYAEYGPWERFWRASLSFIVFFVACAATVFGSPWLMAYGWWFEPGAMLVGLFVKNWHTSVGKKAAPAPRGLDLVVSLLYCAVWVAFLGMAVLIIILHELPSGSH